MILHHFPVYTMIKELAERRTGARATRLLAINGVERLVDPEACRLCCSGVVCMELPK